MKKKDSPADIHKKLKLIDEKLEVLFNEYSEIEEEIATLLAKSTRLKAKLLKGKKCRSGKK